MLEKAKLGASSTLGKVWWELWCSLAQVLSRPHEQEGASHHCKVTREECLSALSAQICSEQDAESQCSSLLVWYHLRLCSVYGFVEFSLGRRCGFLNVVQQFLMKKKTVKFPTSGISVAFSTFRPNSSQHFSHSGALVFVSLLFLGYKHQCWIQIAYPWENWCQWGTYIPERFLIVFWINLFFSCLFQFLACYQHHHLITLLEQLVSTQP